MTMKRISFLPFIAFAALLLLAGLALPTNNDEMRQHAAAVLKHEIIDLKETDDCSSAKVVDDLYKSLIFITKDRPELFEPSKVDAVRAEHSDHVRKKLHCFASNMGTGTDNSVTIKELQTPIVFAGNGITIERRVPTLMLAMNFMSEAQQADFMALLTEEQRSSFDSWQMENAEANLQLEKWVEERYNPDQSYEQMQLLQFDQQFQNELSPETQVLMNEFRQRLEQRSAEFQQLEIENLEQKIQNLQTEGQ